jgi:glycine cleavage system H lipoate-binding protein
MEGFKYVDIFATKGIEYLVAIAFLVLLIFFWRWLNTPAVVNQSSGRQVEAEKISLVDWFRLAKDYYYHQGHTWLNPHEKDMVVVGIDDFAQKLIGKPSKIVLPAVGSHIRQGEKSMNIHIDGKSIDLLSPVDGEIMEINQAVIERPEIINQAPYEKGWLMKIRSEKLNSNLKNLLHGNIAKCWIEDTVDNLSKRITNDYGVVLQDGGTISNGFVRELSPQNWDVVAAEYFMTKDA